MISDLEGEKVIVEGEALEIIKEFHREVVTAQVHPLIQDSKLMADRLAVVEPQHTWRECKQISSLMMDLGLEQKEFGLTNFQLSLSHWLR